MFRISGTLIGLGVGTLLSLNTFPEKDIEKDMFLWGLAAGGVAAVGVAMYNAPKDFSGQFALLYLPIALVGAFLTTFGVAGAGDAIGKGVKFFTGD